MVSIYEKPEFSVIIPAYNEEKYIGLCLGSILSQDYPSHLFEVIVVDNGSTDATKSIVEGFPKVSLLDLKSGNVGAVRNHGAHYAKGENLVFIDADCLTDSHWLQQAHDLVLWSSETIYGGGVRLPERPTWIETHWLLDNGGEPILPKHLIGASILIPKRIFEAVGQFREDITSGEDTELNAQAERSGYKVMICHNLSVTHLGNAKTIKEFIFRQKWHGENYFKNINSSIKDPVFIVILFFLIALILSIASVFLGLESTTLFFFLLTVLTPGILTMKRIYRSSTEFSKQPIGLARIYFIDLLYISGRALGIVSILIKK